MTAVATADQAGAEALRWMVRMGKAPVAYPPGGNQVLWYWLSRLNENNPADAAVLPDRVFQPLAEIISPRIRSRPFITRLDAERTLVNAWRQARAEGWQPED